MMEEELAALKRVLISLVVSSPTTMTVNSLVKDYRNMVGGVLPVSKFGYRDYITFLRERCMDIFVVEGSSWDPILTPKVTKNLKHIDDMVQKQKVQSSVKRKGKRRSVVVAVNPPQQKYLQRNQTFKENNVYPPQNNFRQPPVREPSPGYRARPNATAVKETNASNPSFIQTSNHKEYKHEETVNSCITNGIEDKENINNSSDRPSSPLSNFYKKRLPRYTSDMDLPVDGSSKDSYDSGAHSSSSGTSRLEEMKNEIVELIRDSAEGVWFTDLMRLYKERYGRELSLHRSGHTSLGNLVRSLQDRVAVTHSDPVGDYLLQDPASATAAAAERGRVMTMPPLRRAPRHFSTRTPATNPDDALPGIEIEADVYPEDCLHYLEHIPPADLSSLSGGSQLEVLIGEVYSPSHFWLQRVGPEHNLAMEEVMDRMNEHYVKDTRELVLGAVRVGQYCAAVYEKDWHRSIIVEVVDCDTVKVRHVDYGTVDTVPTSSLRYLRREFASLPAQAVRARLAACRPSARGQRWPHAAATDFLRAVRDKRLYANIVAVDRTEDIVETFLTDTSGPTDVCLSRTLVRLGHAEPRQDSALARDESYLYPRFDALETASTPNYADICRLLDDGIQLDFVDAYRRHVPVLSAAPPAPTAPPEPSLELDDRVSLLRLESPSPTASEKHALSPAPQFLSPSLTDHQPTQSSLETCQATQTSLPQSLPTQLQYQTAQPQHRITQSQYQTNESQYQSGQTFISQFLKSQAEPPCSQYQTTQFQYRTTPSQYQTAQTLSQLQTPQPPHSQYQTSKLPHSQVAITQSAVSQRHSECKATQAPFSQFQPSHSRMQSMLSLLQPQSQQSQPLQNALSQLQSIQTMHSSLLQSQMVRSSPRSSTQPTFQQPPMPTPPPVPLNLLPTPPPGLLPTLLPTPPPGLPIRLPTHSAVPPTLLSPSPPAQYTLLPTPPPAQYTLLPTPPPAQSQPTLLPTPTPAQSQPTIIPTSAVRPSSSPTQPLAQSSFQPTAPRVPTPLGSTSVQASASSAQFQPSRSSTPAQTPLLSAPAQPSSPTAPLGLESVDAVPLPPPNEVRLTERESAVLSHLCATDPPTATWFLAMTAWRSIYEQRSISPFDSNTPDERCGTTFISKK